MQFSPWGCKELDTTEELSLYFHPEWRQGRQSTGMQKLKC